MLYARCAFCGYTDALTCSGRFMPHMPTPVSLTTAGPTCPYCGPLPLVFTCPYMHTQYLYIPGFSSAPQQGYAYAPVVQAQPGASNKALDSAFGEFGKGLGEGIVHAFLGQGG